MKRLVIDTETTGLSPRLNKTLTVGMLLVDVEKDFLNILNSNHIFIKHYGKNVSSTAMKVNKINLVEHNEIAIEEDEACEEINSFIDKNRLHETTLVGHNFHFDRGFLNSLFNRTKIIPQLHNFHEDTMGIWRGLKRERIIPFDLRSTLGTLANYFDIDYKKAHDALADCHITSKVYWEMLKIKDSQTSST